MQEYMITRASIINRCETDGKLHLLFTEEEKPCEEAYLKELISNDGELCSRYFIQLETIEDVDRLGDKYDVDILISKNLDFSGYISLVLFDEDLI